MNTYAVSLDISLTVILCPFGGWWSNLVFVVVDRLIIKPIFY